MGRAKGEGKTNKGHRTGTNFCTLLSWCLLLLNLFYTGFFLFSSGWSNGSDGWDAKRSIDTPLFDFLFFFSSGWLIDELACLINYLLFF
jgi:hypothetical protein